MCSSDLLDDAFEQSSCLNDIGAVLRELGRYEEALTAYRQGVDVYDGGFLQAGCLEGAGDSLCDMKRYEEAVAEYRRGVLVASRDCQRGGLMKKVGEALYEIGQHEKALSAFQQALDYWHEEKNVETQRASCLSEVDNSAEIGRASCRERV